ncbi:Hypothetical Protein FCC1311_059612 [Hondaea fermentalgiana]|uniref:DUF455 family protein n=1 Tax=Hondaea fermentalgiana TaxID=2315210 RepID=A0A2R5GFQ6_9STRA|nr:Hypothetical Protein FCC1311_059612 [Hondaea fermentalgiana]|eukprot:GBG29740.1 Hypothetical Protein FCC1311_059612 [Hondaea fermentalgiana]
MGVLEDSSAREALFAVQLRYGSQGERSNDGQSKTGESEKQQQREQALKQKLKQKQKQKQKQQQKLTRRREPQILDGFPTRELEPFRKRWEHLIDLPEDVKALEGLSLRAAAIRCLEEANPRRKASLTLTAARLFRDGLMPLDGETSQAVPEEPGRDVETVDARAVPKRGGGGSLENRIKMVHALAHIESMAVDLSWDMVARFGFGGAQGVDFPREFYEDWVEVADDEARHFLMWESRLHDFDSAYGAMSTHAGLWDSAKETADLVENRLVVEHMVLEARGLDVAPNTFCKFNDRDDPESADMLEAIFTEEISHVGKGIRWFRFVVTGEVDEIGAVSNAPGHEQQDAACDARFKDIVLRKFHGQLKPPFHDVARERAGMPRHWYDPEHAT